MSSADHPDQPCRRTVDRSSGATSSVKAAGLPLALPVGLTVAFAFWVWEPPLPSASATCNT